MEYDTKRRQTEDKKKTVIFRNTFHFFSTLHLEHTMELVSP